jgi:PAS domain S-box-containing protein
VLFELRAGHLAPTAAARWGTAAAPEPHKSGRDHRQSEGHKGTPEYLHGCGCYLPQCTGVSIAYPVCVLEGSGLAGKSEGGGHRSLRVLRRQALDATDVAFSVTDARQEDNPLVWVNPAFTRLTGFPAAEAVGRNCRFLQDERTDPATVEQLRRAIANRQAVAVTILNRRKDGTTFWNHVSINPVFGTDGEVVSFVGVQTDVTEQVRLNEEHEQALDAERIARRETERARARLSTLVEATTQLAATLDLEEALDRLASISVPRMADWVAINLVDAHGKLYHTTVRHRDGLEDLVARFAELQPVSLNDRSGVYRILAGSEPILLAEASPESVAGNFTDPEMVAVVAGLGLGSVIYVPLISRLQRIVGTMILVATPTGRRFNKEDLEAAADLGRRAGLTIDHARIYEHEHRAAVTLQRSLLPHLPVVRGTTIAARYLPGEDTADVGGDFYDVLPLPDGSIGFAIGDVVGHDMTAAAAMGHLRGILRACAWDDAEDEDGQNNPGLVLDRVDQLVQRLDVASLATLFYGRLTLGSASGERAILRYANAGHPDPLLRSPTGSVTRLTGGAGVLLGVADVGPRPSAEVGIEPGSTLIGYTDGLVERRGTDIDEGIEALAKTLASLPADIEPEPEASRLVATASTDRDDDIALLVLRVDLQLPA